MQRYSLPAPLPQQPFGSPVSSTVYPARLHAEETAKLLGFAPHNIPTLVAAGLLQPLGEPAPNAPKFFATVDIVALAQDRQWLHRATQKVSEYWLSRRHPKKAQV